MALIKCYECSKEISDTAKSCPHCGAGKARECHECSNKMSEDVDPCPNCGAPKKGVSKSYSSQVSFNSIISKILNYLESLKNKDYLDVSHTNNDTKVYFTNKKHLLISLLLLILSSYIIVIFLESRVLDFAVGVMGFADVFFASLFLCGILSLFSWGVYYFYKGKSTYLIALYKSVYFMVFLHFIYLISSH